ncbi:MAG: PAAR domain-containing protein [Halomonas sp.]|nr:PAAR domain-containing protein [Halomonas sp.]MCC5883803.1 PAAR domain-containing protein [Halomonas sp.]
MDLAKVGDKVACSCKGGPHRIVSGAGTAKVDGIPIARVGDKSSCGASITSGVAWYPIEGSPAAIQGSATSCGGQVITGCSTEVGSPSSASTPAAGLIAHSTSLGMTGRQDDSIRASFAENSPEAEYEYVASETEVIMNQPAYLFVEGVGSNGGYIFRVNVTIRDNTLHVSARGAAIAAQIPGGGSVILGMRAELKDGDQLLESAVLQNDGINAWPDEFNYRPVGHATFSLPEPQPGKMLSLHLRGTFQYQTSAGSAAPIPPSTSKMLSLQVIE